MADYAVEYSKVFLKALRVMKRKDKRNFEYAKKKIREILGNPDHFKPLASVLHGFRRVHLGPFVLVYELDGSTIKFIKIRHHDDAYR